MTGLKNRKLVENQDSKAKIIEKNSQGSSVGRCDWLAREFPTKKSRLYPFIEPNLGSRIPTAKIGHLMVAELLLKSARPITHPLLPR